VECGRQPQDVRGGVFCWSTVDTDREWAHRTALEVVSGIYQRDLSASAGRYLVAGTPDMVTTRMRGYADAGAETVVFAPACRGADLERVVDTFATRVLPELHPLSTEPSS
jgi:alkanesulfonate monooxygenase SsuD/methylene tetrahydromethanopterin reductase-like flavin-dependent oxidoreductase (luciferase family)